MRQNEGDRKRERGGREGERDDDGGGDGDAGGDWIMKSVCFK